MVGIWKWLKSISNIVVKIDLIVARLNLVETIIIYDTLLQHPPKHMVTLLKLKFIFI